MRKREACKNLRSARSALHPLPPFPSLVTGDDLTLNLKAVILLHAFNIDVSKCSHRGQNSSTPDLLVREFVEVKGERETGFGNHASCTEVAGFTLGTDGRLDFG